MRNRGCSHLYGTGSTWKECKKRGYEVKIETQGSIGVENELSQEEVDEADVVILAVAICIDGEERFEGKNVFEADVNQTISNPAKIIDEAEKTVK